MLQQTGLALGKSFALIHAHGSSEVFYCETHQYRSPFSVLGLLDGFLSLCYAWGLMKTWLSVTDVMFSRLLRKERLRNSVWVQIVQIHLQRIWKTHHWRLAQNSRWAWALKACTRYGADVKSLRKLSLYSTQNIGKLWKITWLYQMFPKPPHENTEPVETNQLWENECLYNLSTPTHN